MSKTEEQNRAHNGWVATLHEARARCRQALMQADIDVADPRQALWPFVPGELMTNEHQSIAQCHVTVLDYAEHIRPFRNRCGYRWNETLRQPHEFPDDGELPIALSEINQWADMQYKERVGSRDELTGRKRKEKIRRVHIPRAYARDLYQQLNDCMEQLNLAANPPTPEETVDSSEDAW